MTTRRILFLGTHGQHNIGDELLLETFLHQLGAHHSYVVNTYDRDYTSAQLSGRYRASFIDTAADRRELLRHLLAADVVCFGGGSILKELYASTGRNRYATLGMILAIVTFARWVARSPIAMLNIGVGPITTPVGRLLVRLILGQVEEIVVRDPGSLEVCSAAKVDPDRVRLGTDAVFATTREWLLGTTQESPLSDGGATQGDWVDSGEGPLRIGLNLNYDIENPDNWDLFLDRLALGLNRIAEFRSVELHTVPMQSQFKANDDASIMREFAGRLDGMRVVHHDLETHGDVARLLSGLDVLLSERLHAIVIASILGIPSYVLAYDVKVRELSMLLGLEAYTLDINRPFDVEALTASLEALLSDRVRVSEAIRSRTDELGLIARHNFDLARRWVESGRAA